MDMQAARVSRPTEGRPFQLGVIDFNPIQYHVPLYQLLTSRARVKLDVLFLTDRGSRPAIDPGFGVPVKWDIDLRSGYEHQFLTAGSESSSLRKRMTNLARWISGHDAVVIHGHSHPSMLAAAFLCRVHGIPYLLRGDSTARGQATGARRHLRNTVARTVVAASACGLAIGRLNEEFYRQYGAPRIIWAPYSVDDKRFADTPSVSRCELLSRWNLDVDRPVILFCGKLYPGKRPLDLSAAVRLLPRKVNTIFVGDGVLAERVRHSLISGEGVVTGFVNQSELSSYYHAADIIVLPSEVENWGLVINEAMAAGVLPVVSDHVGAAPDLVMGVGEVYPCGDIPRLAEALDRALMKAKEPDSRDRVQQHVAWYALDRTAVGFEQAMLSVASGSSNLITAHTEYSEG